jgi:uncharacterized Zn-finger protein
MSSIEDLRSASSGAGKKRQGAPTGKTVRMYLCEVDGCGKCFARGEHLKRHVRSIHTYEKRAFIPLLELFSILTVTFNSSSLYVPWMRQGFQSA